MTDTTALDRLKSILGPAGWSDDPARLAPKLEDWRKRYHGQTPLLALPANTEEVAGVVSVCAEAGLAITPQGGNTGLVGGGTPQGEVLLSTERMRAIRSVDVDNDSLVAEAGVVLTSVQDCATESDRLFPLSLGSEGTATIGGLISTNAGGVAVLRYGMMRELVLGLEAVLPDGSIWNGLSALRKDNTGYDLKQLLIGAEGTLGVITAASLKLFPRPGAKTATFMATSGPENAPPLMALAKKLSGDAVTAFEIIPANALDLVIQHIPDTRRPVEGAHAWFILMEMSFGDETIAGPMLERTLEAALEADLITDAAIAQNETQMADFWKLRESIPEAETHAGPAVKHDVSTTVSDMPRFMTEASLAVSALMPDARIIAFGHVGDGNVHFNVVAPEGMERDAFLERQGEINSVVYDVVDRMDGSISAEHGIGVLKRGELTTRADAVKMAALRAVKSAMDPRGIMNPRVLVGYSRF